MKIPMPQDQNIVRMFIVGAAFLTVTLALILLQPPASTYAEAPQDSVVRASIEPQEEPNPPLNDDTAITRAATDLTKLTAPKAQASESDALSATVLAALGSGASKAAAPVNFEPTATDTDNALRDMTSSIVASLTGGAAQTAKPKSMEEIIVQALQQGQSDKYIDALLNEAASSGQINVPGALTTNEGRVDTPTLLAALVAKSTTGSVKTTPRMPLGQADGVEVRVVQRAGETKQYNFYTVQQGDSLGAIAHRFYGDASAYKAIFNANRTLISSPDQIRAGQRLSIPEMDSI